MESGWTGPGGSNVPRLANPRMDHKNDVVRLTGWKSVTASLRGSPLAYATFSPGRDPFQKGLERRTLRRAANARWTGVSIMLSTYQDFLLSMHSSHRLFKQTEK